MQLFYCLSFDGTSACSCISNGADSTKYSCDFSFLVDATAPSLEPLDVSVAAASKSCSCGVTTGHTCNFATACCRVCDGTSAFSSCNGASTTEYSCNFSGFLLYCAAFGTIGLTAGLSATPAFWYHLYYPYLRLHCYHPTFCACSCISNGAGSTKYSWDCSSSCRHDRRAFSDSGSGVITTDRPCNCELFQLLSIQLRRLRNHWMNLRWY